MRPVRKITAEEENFRTKKSGPFEVIHRDPVQPEPIGTIVLTAFRIVGYDPDCDGSLMARLEQIDSEGKPTGWDPTKIGLYPDTDLVVSTDELQGMFTETPPPAAGTTTTPEESRLARDAIRQWSQGHSFRDTCLFVERLSTRLSDVEVAHVLKAMDGMCNGCYDAESGCSCQNDE